VYAFRKDHGCQTTLLRLLEDWKTALDKNQYVAAILMDLSKAFDCLPHDILLGKLSASPKSVELLRNYLTGRKQQPVAFLMFILLTSLFIVSTSVGLKSNSVLYVVYCS
jgi:hypothetical protein